MPFLVLHEGMLTISEKETEAQARDLVHQDSLRVGKKCLDYIVAGPSVVLWKLLKTPFLHTEWE